MLLFLVPIRIGGSPNVGIGYLSDLVEGKLESWLPTIVTIVVTISAVLSVGTLILRPKGTDDERGWGRLFDVGLPATAIRALGAAVAWMVLLQIGPAWLVSADTGAVILNDLMTVIFILFVFAAMALPLLTDFGLMEFAGTLLRSVFRPLFRLPGRASIDALASWLGSAPVGTILTIDQYERGFYTAREACSLVSSFSVVSVAFAVVIINFVGLADAFLPFYATLAVCGLAAAIVLPRVPPLSRRTDDLFDPTMPPYLEPEPVGESRFAQALELAVARAGAADPPRTTARRSAMQVLDIWFGLEPLVMVIGAFGLAMAVHTPIFGWLATPLVPVLELLRLPDAAAAAPALIVGFADQFLPVILAQGIPSEVTRFVIACMSVTQLIYMSEVGALLLRSSLPLSVLDLLAIFAWRTVLTLPIAAAAAHLIF